MLRVPQIENQSFILPLGEYWRNIIIFRGGQRSSSEDISNVDCGRFRFKLDNTLTVITATTINSTAKCCLVLHMYFACKCMVNIYVFLFLNNNVNKPQP